MHGSSTLQRPLALKSRAMQSIVASVPQPMITRNTRRLVRQKDCELYSFADAKYSIEPF